jgi:hypothetical protein
VYWFRTSATDVSRHRRHLSHVIGDISDSADARPCRSPRRKPAWSSPPSSSTTRPRPRSSPATAWDRVDKSGKITLRHGGRLYSIGIGRTHTRTHVLVLVQDLDIRIIDAATGELLRELTLDTSQRYQGTGRPPGPTR